MSQAAIEKSRITVGWTSVRILALSQRPLTCYVAVSCPALSARTRIWFVCGEPAYVALDCTNKRRCPIFVDAGRPQTGHRAGSWLCLIVALSRQQDRVFRNVTRPPVIDLALKGGDLLVVSFYFPPSEDISNFCKLFDELEELLEIFPASPALVAENFNARSLRYDSEGRGNLRGKLLSAWDNRLNLSLGNQAGHPTYVRPQGSSKFDLTWGSPAASVRLRIREGMRLSPFWTICIYASAIVTTLQVYEASARDTVFSYGRMRRKRMGRCSLQLLFPERGRDLPVVTM
ncbi:hypothetical protein M0804_001276 [Polistes exclamans]|nr:hypothetical protein M0804_001276 [Polistes exclamans]